jgi:hypothetical protein
VENIRSKQGGTRKGLGSQGPIPGEVLRRSPVGNRENTGPSGRKSDSRTPTNFTNTERGTEE